jgi:hypothetical protein
VRVVAPLAIFPRTVGRARHPSLTLYYVHFIDSCLALWSEWTLGRFGL